MALAQDVAGLVLLPRFQAGVGDDVEAEGVAIKVRRLPGVADEEADMIDPPQGESIFGLHGRNPQNLYYNYSRRPTSLLKKGH